MMRLPDIGLGELAPLLISAGMNALCPATAAVPIVEVSVIQKPAPVVLSLSSAQLGRQVGKPNFTAAAHERWEVGGVTESKMAIQYSATYAGTQSGGAGCFYMSNLQVNVYYNPVVYVASEFANDRCRYNATIEHEQKHVTVDYHAIQRAVPGLRQAALQAAGSQRTQNPVPREQIAMRQNDMVRAVQKAVEPHWQAMLAQRGQWQSIVDTPEEYRRYSAMCPDSAPLRRR